MTIEWTAQDPPKPPEGSDPRGFWECCNDSQGCVMSGPHEYHGEGGQAAWIQPGQSDWPFRA